MWIVQARPITVAADQTGDGFDSEIDNAQLTTAGIAEMLPGVLAPLRWQIAGHLVNEAFARLVSDLGVADIAEADPRPFVRRVRGRAAMDFDALREMAERLPGGSADELEAQYFGSRRPGRPAARPLDRPSRWASLRHDIRSISIERRAGLDAEIAIVAAAELDTRPDLLRMDRHELAAYQFRLIDLATRTTAAEMAVAAASAASYRKIELLLTPHVGEIEAGRWAERVTSGRGVTVTPELDASAAVFAGPTWEDLDRRPPTVRDRHQKSQDEWVDEQAELFILLRSTPSWGGTGLRQALRTRALRQVIEETVTLLHRREASKAALLRVGGEVRRTALDMGRRLSKLAILDEAEDVELLTLGEIEAAFLGEPPPPTMLAHRKRWRNRYLDEPPLPTTFTGSPELEPVELPEGGRHEGWAASPGRYSGIAVAIIDSGDELPVGAVLVAEATDASWSPLFVKAGAIVVERGGPLSHAAILARELGVPAVLNVSGASHALDGRHVTVDGDSGIVVEHDTEAAL